MSKELSCGTCCKHITIEDEMWERGGIATCKFCKMKVRIKPHPRQEQKVPAKGKKR